MKSNICSKCREKEKAFNNSYCQECRNERYRKYSKERIAYMRLVDDIIDKPVGKGDSLYEAVGDGCTYSTRYSLNE